MDQALNMALIGQSAVARKNIDPRIDQAGREMVEIGFCRNFPPHEAKAIPVITIDEQALLAIIHATAQRALCAIQHLHTKKPARELGPILKLIGLHPNITQRGDCHRPAFSLKIGATRSIGMVFILTDQIALIFLKIPLINNISIFHFNISHKMIILNYVLD